MGSDAVYNVTRGTVKPWKHTALGLGLASLTGSKFVNQILNRLGHCISYSEAKSLETEFAYSVAGDERDAPDGIRLDVSGYIEIFPTLLAVYFALNRPNYARWETLFLQKLKSAHPKLREVLENGAFSIRRTKKNYNRSAVDLSLEQTVNRDSASRMKGIVSFRNSESAMRRWSLSMTQRAAAVTELRALVGLEQGETAASQCRPSRIKKDNNQMEELGAKIEEF